MLYNRKITSLEKKERPGSWADPAMEKWYNRQLHLDDRKSVNTVVFTVLITRTPHWASLSAFIRGKSTVRSLCMVRRNSSTDIGTGGIDIISFLVKTIEPLPVTGRKGFIFTSTYRRFHEYSIYPT